ncbi:MAG: hypothetical protein KAU14_06330 [Thermoplasmata archaeon]|nr:hypothetical protein [Thermoplasmata archaeon]
MLLCDGPFDLRDTLMCGQAFRWKEIDGAYYGVVGGRAVRLWRDGKGKLKGTEWVFGV